MKETFQTLLLIWFAICIFLVSIIGFIWGIEKLSPPEQPCILPRNDAQMLNGYEKN